MEITITGPRSIGKSTIAKILAKKLKLKYYSSDEIGEKALKTQGGLDKAIKSGALHDFIKEKGYSLIINIYKKKNFVFDLSGGSISSRKYQKESKKIRKIAKKNSIVIGLLPSEYIKKSIDFLFKRERNRKHFRGMKKQELYKMARNDFRKYPLVLRKFCSYIVYTKGKTADEIANEIIKTIK